MSSRRAALGTASAALAVLLASSASCGFFGSGGSGDGPPPRPFSHKAHLERGLECAICHETAETEVKAGMPSRETCMLCHEELDQDPAKPLEKKVAWFKNEAGELAWSDVTRQSPEILFSHKAHAERGVSCAACHEGMAENEGLSGRRVQSMRSCMACHAEQAPERNDCATCHRELRRDVAPVSHNQLWMSVHGPMSRLGSAISTSNDCAMCHTRDSCTTCHQTRPPADHNEFFRIRSHGFAAAVDRSRCTVCHTTDGCVRCHLSTAPVSHGAGFASPFHGHCRSCHLPVATSQGCSTCHRAAPAHDASPTMPAWHHPALDCRSCHSVSLKHPDNGDSCTACHR